MEQVEFRPVSITANLDMGLIYNIMALYDV